uniref:Ig-like domain-containing protein n=1 Tax=Sphenodon punctatus TaxID=8508 RepID=A0A8D0HKE2_SPHPU
MRGGGLPGLALLCLALGSIQCEASEPIVGVEGEEAIFSPKIAGVAKEITWKKNGHKVAEWDNGTVMFFQSLKDRAELLDSGKLTIHSIAQEDVGTYKSEALVDGQYQEDIITLQVLARPSPPTLNCSVVGDHVLFRCTGDSELESYARYRWERGGKVVDLNTITIPLGEDVGHSETAMCIVSVSKTEVNSSISLSSCFPEDPSNVRRRYVLVVVVVVAVAAAVILTLVYLYKKGHLNTIHSRIFGKRSGAPESTGESPESEKQLLNLGSNSNVDVHLKESKGREQSAAEPIADDMEPDDTGSPPKPKRATVTEDAPVSEPSSAANLPDETKNGELDTPAKLEETSLKEESQ